MNLTPELLRVRKAYSPAKSTKEISRRSTMQPMARSGRRTIRTSSFAHGPVSLPSITNTVDLFAVRSVTRNMPSSIAGPLPNAKSLRLLPFKADAACQAIQRYLDLPHLRHMPREWRAIIGLRTTVRVSAPQDVHRSPRQRRHRSLPRFALKPLLLITFKSLAHHPL